MESIRKLLGSARPWCVHRLELLAPDLQNSVWPGCAVGPTLDVVTPLSTHHDDVEHDLLLRFLSPRGRTLR